MSDESVLFSIFLCTDLKYGTISGVLVSLIRKLQMNRAGTIESMNGSCMNRFENKIYKYLGFHTETQYWVQGRPFSSYACQLRAAGT